MTAGLDTIALRSLLIRSRALCLPRPRLPIAAPSANRSGRVSPTNGGACRVGAWRGARHDPRRRPVQARDRIDRGQPRRRERLSCSGSALPRARRSSAFSGQPLAVAKPDAAIASPGQLATHYAPDTRLRLGATSVAPDEALLAFGRHVPKGARFAINLSESGDLNEAAAKLFGALRELDQAGRERHRRHADSRSWARRSHQRPPAARDLRSPSHAALAISDDARAEDISARARRRSMRSSASSARSTRSATQTPWRPISSNGATAIAARRRSCSSPARPSRSRPSSSLPTRRARPSCRKAAIPGSSAGRSRSRRAMRSWSRSSGSTACATSTLPRTA